MRCPICNCKMPRETMCPYCKITGEEVRFASNKEAKIAIREGNKEDIHYSSIIAYDVDKLKLILFTIFFGWLGVNNFFVGRIYKGLFFISSFVLAFIFVILTDIIGIQEFSYPTDLLTFICAILVVVWFSDILNLFFGKFKMPVKLATPEEVNIRKRELEELRIEKEKKRQEKERQAMEKTQNKLKQKEIKRDRKKDG